MPKTEKLEVSKVVKYDRTNEKHLQNLRIRTNSCTAFDLENIFIPANSSISLLSLFSAPVHQFSGQLNALSFYTLYILSTEITTYQIIGLLYNIF